jgi:hypothetical protein
MNISRDYINPKYYADFQRRYKKDMKKYTIKKKKPISNQNTTDDNYHVLDLTPTDELTTTQVNNISENGKKLVFIADEYSLEYHL